MPLPTARTISPEDADDLAAKAWPHFGAANASQQLMKVLSCSAMALPCLLILPRSPTIRKSAVSGGIMLAVRSRKFQFSLWLAAAFSVSMWPAASEAYTPEQQAACSDDAFRLCSADIPDVDRVTACMVRKQDQLSPGCRVYFRPSEPEPAVRAGAPLNIKPAASRKPVSERQ
jgi:hypothetical protein